MTIVHENSDAPHVPPRPPGENEVIYLATRNPDSEQSQALLRKLRRLSPCVTGGPAYVEHQRRIWGIVTWAPPSLVELFKAHRPPPRLAWLHQSGVGVEEIARLPTPAGVTVTNIKGNTVYAAPMAELVVARILEWAKELPRLAANQAKREWTQFDPPTLVGKTAIIFGYGTIGAAVAKRLVGFDMTVLAARLTGKGDATAGVVTINMDEARARLADADYVILAMPLTAKTQGCIGAIELARMKSTAFIVNVGRAALIDEPALAAALREHRLGGVALDVFWREPLPLDDDVWTWPGIAISPHMSANIQGGNADAIADVAVETLERILAGKPLTNRVNLAAGY